MIPIKAKRVIFPITTGLVVVVITFAVVIPKLKDYHQQKAEYEKFCRQLKQISQYGDILFRKRHLYLEIAKKWESFSKEFQHLNTEKDIIKNFVNQDTRSNLKIQYFEHNYEQQAEGGKVIYFTLQVQGYFEDIRNYLEQLENTFPVITVTQLTMKPDERFSGSKRMLTATIQGNVLVVL